MTTARVSLCVNLFNRAATFRPCLESILASAPDAEIVVCDWWSSDVDPATYLSSTAKLVRALGEFDLNIGRNLAGLHATRGILFFCDADMIVAPHVVARGIEIADAGKAFFPLYSGGTGHGTGNCILSSDLFARSGGWPLGFAPGSEDSAFFLWFVARALCEREQSPGFNHQPHRQEIP